MARPKEFDVDVAVAAAAGVFKDHGYEGTSAQMLVDAMGIGRQSLYDTFGDKWGIYCAAMRQYCQNETRAHSDLLASQPRAIDGIRAMFDRVVDEAATGCLGLGSIVEFGCKEPDIVKIRDVYGEILANAMRDALAAAREQGDVAPDQDLDHLTTFTLQMISTIRLTARAGATSEHIAAMAPIALRALR
ncbi:TetR/AcrR family transcriptional regulator [Novosphingobium sp. P6W]|uniref:TetR/AcrR family transcriptional regulator n=1 Tax=Novosphingobium sp. P6W TaxID=1609758 RepID=UPI0005C2BA9E|nr:TetR/AcrR family transcriptional regulator [Novosphingobium sp. P6W]AXB78908.1 TetR/AcrR family transcriptional regulator [Novosphingobium sp. P6W]KIS30052.1 TetR family transcriptional regulator [Novosphingobium sp. P6W]